MSNATFSQILMEYTTIFRTIVILHSQNGKGKNLFCFLKFDNGTTSLKAFHNDRMMESGININECSLVFSFVLLPHVFRINLYDITGLVRNHMVFERSIPRKFLLWSSDEPFLFVEFVDRRG